MSKLTNRPRTIASHKLKDVAGGIGAPVKPAPIHTPNMGFPKYSAGWWDLVRSGTLGQH